jgi:uncharacterized protein YhdP
MTVQRTAVWVYPQRNQPIRLPERLGTLVYGSLPEFDFDRWLPLLSTPGGGDAQTVSMELRFGSLTALGRRFGNVALRASAESSGWSANVNADEVAGDLSYRARPQPRIIARLSRLNIPADHEPAKPKADPRPVDYPAVDLVVEDFNFRGKPFGRVELVASRAGEDWRIERASMANPDATLSARGMWFAAPSRTALQFDLEAGDFGTFLGRVGNPNAVNPAGYYGLYQFSPATWRSVGGTGLPTDYGEAEQTLRAKKLYQSQGDSPWPNCGSRLYG